VVKAPKFSYITPILWMMNIQISALAQD